MTNNLEPDPNILRQLGIDASGKPTEPARPKKSLIEGTLPLKPADEDLGELVHTGSAYLAQWRGDHWTIERSGADMFAASLEKVAEKYGWLDPVTFPPEVALMISTVVVFGPALTTEYALWATNRGKNGDQPETRQSEQSQPVSGEDGRGENHGAEAKPDAFTETDSADRVGSGEGSPTGGTG